MIDTLTSPLLAKHPAILHFFTTRTGGTSKPPFQWANMSIKSGDPDALENRKKLASQLGVPLDRFVFMNQIHSDNILYVNEKHAGHGSYTADDAINGVDAMFTDTANLMLIVTTADCVPVLIADTKKGVIAAVHAGWRGTSRLITFKTIQKLKDGYRSRPEDIIVALGPSIGPCCYEVGEDVLQAFRYTHAAKADDFFISKNGKLYLDLWKSNLYQLQQAGIPEANIDLLGQCTSCYNDRFYSARRGDKGRQIAGIMLKSAHND